MIKILIAEDEQGILDGISNAFSWENMGCEISGLAQDGIHALELCLSNPPDLIISDIVMPDTSISSIIVPFKKQLWYRPRPTI